MEIRRDIYLEKLLRKRHNGLVKVVTGLRRCGKSFLLFDLFKRALLEQGVPADHIIEMPFDDFENRRYRNPEILYPYIKRQITDDLPYYILLDEVQLLDDFESVLNGLARIKNIDLYVTGSNARFLSKDVITEFRGRGDEIHMFPLSFAEYVSAYPGTKEEAWREYVLYGGLPLIFNFRTAEEKEEFLKALFEETYISDVVGRNNIRHKGELEELLNILSSGIGSLTNPNKLAHTFQSVKQVTMSKNTIERYIRCLMDAFLIDKSMRYDVKGKRYINSPAKYYFTDMGLRNARLNFRQLEETHAMENIIYNELKIRAYNVDVGVISTNERNRNGSTIRKQMEIDFVCNKGSKRYYVQSAYSIPDAEKLRQEQRSLISTGDFFKKILITKDGTRPHYNDSGILMMNIYDFLLDPGSLEL